MQSTVVHSVTRCVSELGAPVVASSAVKSGHVVECDPGDMTPAPKILMKRKNPFFFFAPHSFSFP